MSRAVSGFVWANTVSRWTCSLLLDLRSGETQEPAGHWMGAEGKDIIVINLWIFGCYRLGLFYLADSLNVRKSKRMTSTFAIQCASALEEQISAVDRPFLDLCFGFGGN